MGSVGGTTAAEACVSWSVHSTGRFAE